jgi:hypothetical protein
MSCIITEEDLSDEFSIFSIELEDEGVIGKCNYKVLRNDSRFYQDQVDPILSQIRPKMFRP